ncbi:MAG: methyltransferase family protein [Candidatus Hermodarchaeota archaeon]
MQLKGWDKLKEKLPKYVGWRAVGLGLLLLLAFATAFTLMVLIDSVARIFPYVSVLVLIEPILPVLGALLCQLIAFRLIWSVWNNRDRYMAELEELAYQKAFPQAFFGISWIFGICVHIYVPIEILPTGTPVNPFTFILSQSLLTFFGMPVGFDLTIRIIGSFIFIIFGMLTIRSALLTFGVDYMTLVYLYYPAESQIQQHEIYSVIRHPTYLGALFFAMGGLWLRFSVYSLMLFFIFLLGFMVHIVFVEEKELRERFGEAFIEYQKRVPALHIRLRDLRVYLRFLTKRSTEEAL